MHSVMLRTEDLAQHLTLHLRGGVRIPVLADVGLTVHAGECVVLSGPSGAGKTTLMLGLYGDYRAADARHCRGTTANASQRPHGQGQIDRSGAGRSAAPVHAVAGKFGAARMSMYASMVASTRDKWYSDGRRMAHTTLRHPMGQRRTSITRRIRFFPHRISTTTRMRMAYSPMAAVPLQQGTTPGHPGTPRPGARARRRVVSSRSSAHNRLAA